MEGTRPHVIIIGGGFGGLAAARRLSEAPVRVTLLDRQNYHLFQPLLYQVATAALSPGDIAAPIRWILRRQQNLSVLLASVRAIDTATRAVQLADGSLSYDYLIVAAGATHAYFGHSNWEPLAPGLKTLEDALEIRRRVLLAYEAAERESDPAAQKRLLTFVIVGGGPTGVELAGALGEIARQTLSDDFRNIRPASARIILLEGGPSILPTFPERLRRFARAELKKRGVEVREHAVVTNVDPGRVWLGTEQIEAATVLWAAGVAASPLGQTLEVPLDRAGRVIVQADLTIPGHPEVFVIGDLALLRDEKGTALPGVAQVAMQQGAHAAKNITRAIAGQPLVPFRYRDLGSMATIGRNAAVADFGWLRITGFPAWLVWLFIHIMQLVSFRSRLLVLLEGAWSYITFQRSVRLITGRPDLGLPRSTTRSDQAPL